MSIANTISSFLERRRAHNAQPKESTYTVTTCRGTMAYATSATGAFRALQAVPIADRSSAAIYDEDGLCLYR